MAARRGVRTETIAEPDNIAFSDRLAAFAAAEGVHYIVTASFRRLLAGALLSRYRGRLFNIHPSLLPAFPGLNPIDQQLGSDARILGNTVHMIDASIDGGPIVMQSVVQRPDGNDPEYVRHRLFEHACQGLVQLVAWLWQGRLSEGPDGVRIRDAQRTDPAFCPGLDDPEAAALALAYPWWERAEYRALAHRMGKPVLAA